ncbi:MAG: phosphoglucosamine mutase [Lachnospiraceae bacterium]|nr:phosphoglucosamine mutase [Lachnospiraceae bacterium]MBQ6994487.1 phosphoglucosamine mutase [Lachnospiraceae bacterium]
MDQALPQIDKVLQLAEIFSVSTDELLLDKIEINRTAANEPRVNKYFGTDGFRGEANVTLTSMQAYRVGRFLGWYYASKLSGCTKPGYRPRIVIGKDTRRSSYMLEYSIVAGITASGADAYMLHVITTPGVSYVTRKDEFDCGIMITASHNPYYDNGIKVINAYGEKLDDETTALIEAYIDGDLKTLGVTGDDLPLAQKSKIGCIHDYSAGRNRYIGYLISLASNSYKNLRIGLDCANGASWNIAGAVFSALGAQIYVIGDEPDGLNCNEGCGSTHLEPLKKLVREKHLDLGFAFDGDADRCIAVDENGNEVDGDAMIYVLGKRLKMRGTLEDNTVVTTIMSNSGFVASLEEIGIKCVQTKVGDRFVYECMQNNNYAIGGEQTGHIIVKKYATTGDGILSAILLAEEICDSKTSLAKLVEPIKFYPQHLQNVRVKDKEAVLADAGVLKAKDEVEKLINKKGRALLRQSGTESVIRVMVESETQEKCVKYVEMIVNAIAKGGHCVE